MSKELLPEPPEMEWVAYDRANECEVYAHTDYAMRAYGQACYEAGRKAACVYRQAVDIELINAHIGTAEGDDTLEGARKKLGELLKWWESVGEYFADKKPAIIDGEKE